MNFLTDNNTLLSIQLMPELGKTTKKVSVPVVACCVVLFAGSVPSVQSGDICT
jgi:uncharacterized membrane protein YoaK (UPF0700 family)